MTPLVGTCFLMITEKRKKHWKTQLSSFSAAWLKQKAHHRFLRAAPLFTRLFIFVFFNLIDEPLRISLF